jgi:hypothetical protein
VAGFRRAPQSSARMYLRFEVSPVPAYTSTRATWHALRSAPPMTTPGRLAPGQSVLALAILS